MIDLKKMMIIGFVVFLSNLALAQESNVTKLPISLAIPAKALLSLQGTDQKLNFSFIKDGQKQIISPKSSGKVWLNYSSVVEPGSTNTICVSLGSNNLPAEVSIKLTVAKDVGAGSGQVGEPSAPIILSEFPQQIISNIGSCYTGKGENAGHLLTYSWELSEEYDPELVKIEELQLEAGIIYTIVNK